MQSIFDTIALALILINARMNGGGGLLTLIAKQGLAYYMFAPFLFLAEGAN